MKCRHCNTEVNVLDKHCHSCGKSLSILDGDSSRFSTSKNSLLDVVSGEIDKELNQLQQDIISDKCPDVSTPENQSSQSWKFEYLSPPQKLNFMFDEQLHLETNSEDILQIAQFVFYSTHVRNNKLYKQRAETTTLKYFPDENIVNAFATDQPIDDIDADPPLIAVFGGLAHAIKLASTGLGYDAAENTSEARETFIALIKSIGHRIVENEGDFSDDDVYDIYDSFSMDTKINGGEAIRKARSYAAAMNMAVIAHELGHIALGHTLGSGSHANYEISRNQEREADSFASSVASASPFSDYIVAGGIFWWVILTWVESSSGQSSETTHPHSRERLMDYIRANKDQAGGIGIDEDNIKVFLP